MEQETKNKTKKIIFGRSKIFFFPNKSKSTKAPAQHTRPTNATVSKT